MKNKFSNRPWYGKLIPVCFTISHRIRNFGRWLLFKSVEGRCAYCGKREDKLTIDHVIPRSKLVDQFDAKSHVANYLPACHKCNNLKSNLRIKTFRRLSVGEGGLFFFEDGIAKDITIEKINEHKKIIKQMKRKEQGTNETLRARLREQGILSKT